MELKKEKSEILDTVEDIDNELYTMNDQFDKLKEDNYKFYKEENVYSMIDLIMEGEICEVLQQV